MQSPESRKLETLKMRSKSPILAILLLLFCCAAPAVAIFGPPTERFTGRINFLQKTNFTLLTDQNKLVRIMVAMDRQVPAEVQLGVKVKVKAVQGNDGRWYLDKFEEIQLQPTP